MPIQKLSGSPSSLTKPFALEQKIDSKHIDCSSKTAVVCAQRSLSRVEQPTSKAIKKERAKSWHSKRNIVIGTILAIGVATLLKNQFFSALTPQKPPENEGKNLGIKSNSLANLDPVSCTLSPSFKFFADTRSILCQKPKTTEPSPPEPPQANRNRESIAYSHAMSSFDKVKKLSEMGRYAHALSIAKSIQTRPDIRDNALTHLIDAVKEESWEMALKAAAALSPNSREAPSSRIIFEMQKKYDIAEIFTLTQGKIPENIKNDFYVEYATRLLQEQTLTKNIISLIASSLSMVDEMQQLNPNLIETALDRCNFPIQKQWQLVQKALARDSLLQKESITHKSDIQSLIIKFVTHSIKANRPDLAEQAVDNFPVSIETFDDIWKKVTMYKKIRDQLGLLDSLASWFREDTDYARVTNKIHNLDQSLIEAYEKYRQRTQSLTN